jgi:hypothetical protein
MSRIDLSIVHGPPDRLVQEVAVVVNFTFPHQLTCLPTIILYTV